ncbi:hypothetical protein [Georgenia sp. AZ-5]|uniref:hypothetical protein n=1 Tax=Georgenia sp. AZ-5 TaxID=3367526 RepID=UPI003754A110
MNPYAEAESLLADVERENYGELGTSDMIEIAKFKALMAIAAQLEDVQGAITRVSI